MLSEFLPPDHFILRMLRDSHPTDSAVEKVDHSIPDGHDNHTRTCERWNLEVQGKNATCKHFFYEITVTGVRDYVTTSTCQ
jgi:hypothetical protein